MIKLGHRVKVMSIGRKGSVEFIDWPRLSTPWMYPIQITLDRPYGECKTTMYRTTVGDLKKLKKKAEVQVDDLTQFKKYLKDV